MFNLKGSTAAFIIMMIEFISLVAETLMEGSPSIGTKISLSILISTLLIITTLERKK